MSIYSKIHSLLTAANATTGESDTTLTDAVQTLVDGYGQGGGGVTADGVAMGTEPSGAVTITNNVSTIIERAFFKNTGMTSLTIQGSPYFSNYCFGSCTNLVSVSLPSVTRIYSSNYNTAQYVFNGCSKLEYVVLPSYGNYAIDSYNFQNCTSLIGFDTANMNRFGNSVFYGDADFNILVIRKSDSVPQLSSPNAFGNTPFASGNSGGTLYVPSALISSYQSASNWSTILGYTNNSIKSIESTATDPTAPVDLTTHYVDGTVIS